MFTPSPPIGPDGSNGAVSENSPESPESGLSRRKILHYLWSLPLIVGVIQLLRMISDFTLAGEKNPHPAMVDLGTINELPEKLGAPLYHRRGRFWLLNNEDGVVAITNPCSHLECLFDWDSATGNFVCPCHGSRFDRHGRVLNGPATRDLDRYPLQLISPDGEIIGATEEYEKSLVLPAVPDATAASNVEGSEQKVDDTGKEEPAPPLLPHLRVKTDQPLRSDVS